MSRHLIELKTYLATRANHYRRPRCYADLLHVEVTQRITADLTQTHDTVKRTAHTAECHDLEALRLIRVATADGKITRAEIPLLTRALRHIGVSSRATHRIGEILA